MYLDQPHSLVTALVFHTFHEALCVLDHPSDLLISEIKLASFNKAHQQQWVTACVILNFILCVITKGNGTVVAPPSVQFCLLK